MTNRIVDVDELAGQREIERARREPAERMGDRFGLGVFHAEVVDHCTLPLNILRLGIPGWVEAATQRALTAGLGERPEGGLTP